MNDHLFLPVGEHLNAAAITIRWSSAATEKHTKRLEASRGTDPAFF